MVSEDLLALGSQILSGEFWNQADNFPIMSLSCPGSASAPTEDPEHWAVCSEQERGNIMTFMLIWKEINRVFS